MEKSSLACGFADRHALIREAASGQILVRHLFSKLKIPLLDIFPLSRWKTKKRGRRRGCARRLKNVLELLAGGMRLVGGIDGGDYVGGDVDFIRGEQDGPIEDQTGQLFGVGDVTTGWRAGRYCC